MAGCHTGQHFGLARTARLAKQILQSNSGRELSSYGLTMLEFLAAPSAVRRYWCDGKASMGSPVVGGWPRRTDLDLHRIGTNQQHRIRPDGKRSVLNPCRLNIAKLVPTDGGPRTCWLGLLESQHGDFSSGFLFTFYPDQVLPLSIRKLLPLAPLLNLPGPAPRNQACSQEHYSKHDPNSLESWPRDNDDRKYV